MKIKIIDIFWERANLHIKFDKKVDDQIYLIRKTEQIELNEEASNEVVINMTNTPEGTMLTAANWRLLAFCNDIVLDAKLIKKLDDFSRIFTYRKERFAYLVYFSIDNKMHLNIKTKFMVNNNKPEFFYRLSETKTIKGKTSIIFKRIGVSVFNFYYVIMHLLFSRKDNVLFLTENNDELTWNLKMMHDYLEKKDLYNISVFADNKFDGKKNLFKYIKETFLIAKASTIFVDNYTPLLTHIRISKNVKLVQLWHAGIGFKSVGYARFGIKGSPHPYKSCHRKYTHAYVDQEKLVDIYKEVYGTSGEIFKSTGIPRLDNYVNQEKIKTVTNELYKVNPKIKDHKVVLFSPTYRGNGSSSAYYDYSLLDLDVIYDYCKNNKCLFIVKMHPFISVPIRIPKEYSDLIIDYSEMDINDLIYVSDIMITDYSSCAYEYSFFDRPLLFYRFDKVIYEYERPLHSVDSFTDKQFEIETFEDMMNVLNDITKDIDVKNRFKNIIGDEKRNSCEKIEKDVFGD